jgi:murein DD-endopeptidase MepM/ murein hydrolase activator NlpD
MTGTDIGREPALSFSAQNQEPSVDRRMLNIRWLACTVLTGLAGASLMGGALFIAFDRQAEFADSPHRSLALQSVEGGVTGLGRADRLELQSASISNRQIIQESTVRTVGGKEFVQVLPYVRVTASLSMTRGEHAASLPPFNPIDIFAEVGAMKSDTVAADAPEAEETLQVTFATLKPAETEISDEDVLDVSDIEQLLRETVSFEYHDLAYAPPVILPVSVSDMENLSGISLTGQPSTAAGLGRAAASGANTTIIAKRNPAPAKSVTEEVDVEISRGDTLMSMLVDHGATRSEAMEIIAALEEESEIPRLQVGNRIRLTLAPAEDDHDRLRPIRVKLPGPDGDATTVAVADPATFMSRLSALGSLGLRRASSAAESARQTASRANVYDSIYETGLGHDVPKDLIDELVRIFAFDVDFQRSVSLGDALEVFYADSPEENADEDPHVLYAAVSLRGETHRFYRFRTPDDGVVDYYDETGKSAKKFLMRKPLSGGTFRSAFGMRRHPILGYSRMHNGVDWAARTGTPIMAAGSGTVLEAQWRSGYGKHVVIRHANGYETSYSHMSGFGDGVQPGARVHQGQVIGYVGSTGMSTGPHLHYEVTVNGRHVDPMRIRLPRGRTLEGRMLAAFEKEKARIDALMNRAPASTRMAAR